MSRLHVSDLILGFGYSQKTVFDVLRMSTYIVSELVPVLAILIYLKQVPGTASRPLSRPNNQLPKQAAILPVQSRFTEEPFYTGSLTGS